MNRHARFFARPKRIDDMRRPCGMENLKKYIVEKEIYLSNIDYNNFITDMLADRWFLDYNAHLCGVDEDGVWHCILVRGEDADILVMPDGDMIEYAACI